MKWMITGGSGFIGAGVAAWLAERGQQCLVADNLQRSGSRRNRDLLRRRFGLAIGLLDLRDSRQVNAFWRAHCDIDVVLHLAAQVSLVASLRDPRLDFETNTLGTFNALEATRLHAPQASFIYASSNKVYGDLRRLRIQEAETRYALPDYPAGLDESLPVDPHGGYSSSKAFADQLVRDYHRVFGLRTVVLRQSSVYGAGQYAAEDQGWVAYFARMGVERRTFRIAGDGKQVRDLLHLTDLNACFQAIAGASPDSPIFGQALNIGGGPGASLSLVELFSRLRDTFGLSVTYSRGPWRPGDQKVFVADTGKASRLLGWAPRVGLDEGLAEVVAWSCAQYSSAA